MIKEIIFDFDGTIADSFGVIMDIFYKNKADLGFENFGEKEVKIYRQRGVKFLLTKNKISFLKVAKILKLGKEQMEEKISEVKAFDKMEPVLNELKKKGIVLGIMSTNSQKNIKKFLKKNKINEFNYVVGKGSLFSKSRILKNVLKKRNLSVDEVLYVGDEVRDIEACRKLGIKIIAVTWGFNDKKLLKKNRPDFLIDKPKEILKLV